MLNLGALVASLGIDTAGLAQATRDMKKWEQQVNSSVNAVNSKLRTTGAEMKKVGRSMSRYMTVPLMLAGGASFKLAKDFEFSMSKIVSLVGVAQGTVDAWAKDLLILAPQLGKAPKELADALYFVTSAGFRTEEAMNIVKMSAKASASGLGETKVVADLVTSAMNAYSPAVLSAADATDILVNTVREGKVESEALTGSLGWVIPVASALGVSFDQVGAAVASMTRTGTNARTASVQLRQILFSMLKPSDQARDGLEAMGTSAHRLRKTLREDGLISTLTELKELQKEYGEETLATIFPNIRALAGVLDIVGKNMENNIGIFKSLSNSTGLSAKAFEVASNTVEFKWNQALTQGLTTLLVFGKTLAEVMLSVLQLVIKVLSKITAWFNNLSSAAKKLIIYVGGLVTALGPLLIILGFLVGNVLPGLLRLGAKAVRVFAALKIAMLTNPVTFFAGALAIVATALITFRKRTEEATTAQIAENEAVEKGYRAYQNMKSVQDRMMIMHTLNKRQMKDLRMQIENQILVEEDLATKIIEEKNKVYNNDKKINEFRKQILNAENGVEYAAARNRLFLRQAYLAKGLTAEHEASYDRLNILKDYLEKVEKAEKEAEAKKNLVKSRKNDINLEPMTPISFGGTFTDNDTWVERMLLIAAMQESLGGLTREYEMFGGALNIARQKQELLKSTILSLINLGISPESEQIRNLMLQYDLWKAKTDELTEAQKKLNEEERRQTELTKKLGDAAAQASIDILHSMGQAMVGTENAWESLVTTILQGAQQIIDQLLMVAIAAMIEDSTASAGVAGLAIAAVGIAALLALWTSAQSDVSGLATGGTVTEPGTFMVGERGPELISLPNGASVTSNRDLQRMGTEQLGGKVIFEIEGRKLMGILKQEDTFNNIY